WTCESDDSLQYCMTVHSCTADDGQGIGQQIIDEKGCTLDNFLMRNLDYGDNLVAGQEAHVFKFADKPTIFFACMIRLELKEDAASTCMTTLFAALIRTLFNQFTPLTTDRDSLPY
ncbi:hypothetical protein ANCDUO_10739, partial [Ancylostoma duodenale]